MGVPQTEEEVVDATKEERMEEDASKTSPNLIGVSDDLLDRLYNDGAISRYDYETEVSARDAKREQMLEEETEFSKDMNRLQEAANDMNRSSEAIRDATADDANSKLTAKQRLDILESLDKQRDSDREKAIREEESEKTWQVQFLE